jgi:TolB-like protein
LSHISYLEEPFVPMPNGPSLSSLAAKGVQVESLQSLCLQEYSSWALTRLEYVLDDLAKLDPLPDIIIFPEGSVPINGLELATAWGSKGKSMVLAGTHTPLSTTDAKQGYGRAGIPSDRIKKLTRKGVKTVLPLTYDGKTKLIEKRSFSPFEQSVISRPEHKEPINRSYRLKCPDGEISVLPMICAEALQSIRFPKFYDLVAIISYDVHPEQFLPFVNQQVSNRKAVAFCNDGHAGGTMLYCADDQRRPNWLRDALPRGLPPGDSLLVVDVDLDVTAVEMGTAVPHYALRLVALKAVIPQLSNEFQITETVKDIKNIQTSEGKSQELSNLLKSESLTPLQKTKFDFLCEQEKRGVPDEDWWQVLGSDCIAAGIPSLQQLEATLAKSCNEHLLESGVLSPERSPETSQDLVKFMAQCQTRGGATATTLRPTPAARVTSTINRESEAEEISGSFDISTVQLEKAMALPDKASIAVLPFDNLSGDSEQEYFVDGVVEDILMTLSKVRYLFVIARHSSFVYKGKSIDVRTVGAELGVRNVLEGSVRKSGNRVRLSAQLIDCANGQHLWADRYEGNLDDVFELQDRITQEIVTALEIELSEGEQVRIWRERSGSPLVYEHYHKARVLYFGFAKDANQQARIEIEQALSINPNYTPALVMLGYIHADAARFGWADDPDASLAQSLDCGGYAQLFIRDFDSALRNAQKAFALSPNSSDACHVAAIIQIYAGNAAEGVHLEKLSLRLNPLVPTHAQADLGRAYFHIGKLEEAKDVLRLVVKRRPQWLTTRALLVAALHRLGETDEAKRQVEEIMRINPRFSVARWAGRFPYRDQGDLDAVMEPLKEAGLPNVSGGS